MDFFPFLNHYLRIFILCFVLFFSILAALNRLRFPTRWRRITIIASSTSLVFYSLCVLLYMSSDFISDHVESSVMTISWLWREGYPMYHDPDAAQRYSMIYGPLMYASTRA